MVDSFNGRQCLKIKKEINVENMVALITLQPTICQPTRNLSAAQLLGNLLLNNGLDNTLLLFQPSWYTLADRLFQPYCEPQTPTIRLQPYY